MQMTYMKKRMPPRLEKKARTHVLATFRRLALRSKNATLVYFEAGQRKLNPSKAGRDLQR